MLYIYIYMYDQLGEYNFVLATCYKDRSGIEHKEGKGFEKVKKGN